MLRKSVADVSCFFEENETCNFSWTYSNYTGQTWTKMLFDNLVMQDCLISKVKHVKVYRRPHYVVTLHTAGN